MVTSIQLSITRPHQKTPLPTPLFVDLHKCRRAHHIARAARNSTVAAEHAAAKRYEEGERLHEALRCEIEDHYSAQYKARQVLAIAHAVHQTLHAEETSIDCQVKEAELRLEVLRDTFEEVRAKAIHARQQVEKISQGLILHGISLESPIPHDKDNDLFQPPPPVHERLIGSGHRCNYSACNGDSNAQR
jgi:hypothetical protein